MSKKYVQNFSESSLFLNENAQILIILETWKILLHTDWSFTREISVNGFLTQKNFKNLMQKIFLNLLARYLNIISVKKSLGVIVYSAELRHLDEFKHDPLVLTHPTKGARYRY